jgi:hypothetical protein
MVLCQHLRKHKHFSASTKRQLPLNLHSTQDLRRRPATEILRQARQKLVDAIAKRGAKRGLLMRVTEVRINEGASLIQN